MKNLINSSIQRNIIVLLLIIAIFGFTLPAAHIGPKSFSLLKDDYGTIMLIGVIFSTIIIFFREEFHALLEKKIEQKFSENIISFIALVPIIAVLWRLIALFIETKDELGSVSYSQDMLTSFFGSKTFELNAGISFWFYLVIFLLICAIVCILAFPQVEKVTKIVQNKITETHQKHQEDTENESKTKKEENNQNAIEENSESTAETSEDSEPKAEKEENSEKNTSKKHS